MSRVLKKFPEPRNRRRVLPKYDWATWFDGRVHALSPSEYGNVQAIRNAAWRYAKHRGVRVRTCVNEHHEFVIEAELPAISLGKLRPHSVADQRDA